jgi:peptidoglycan-associated lipoprotein
MNAGLIVRAAVLAVVGMFVAGCQQSTGTETPPASTAAPQSASQAPQQAPARADDRARYADGRAVETTVYFDYDKAVIRPEFQEILAAHGRFLRDNTGKSVLIEGHCDERGSREYNLALGERRADAVRDYLVAEGAARSQIEGVSYGEERPVDPGHDEGAWSKNRRGEIVYR